MDPEKNGCEKERKIRNAGPKTSLQQAGLFWGLESPGLFSYYVYYVFIEIINMLTFLNFESTYTNLLSTEAYL